MIKYLLNILMLILCGCSNFNRPSYVLSEDEKLVNEIRKKVAIELMKKTGLQPCGTGAQMMDQIKMLALAFFYYTPIEIEEGRKLLVTAVENFLSTINSDERIFSYLYNYPFEAKNIEIVIVIRNPDHSSIDSGKICLIAARDGNCIYDVSDAKTGLLKTIYKETFPEAQQKLREHSPP